MLLILQKIDPESKQWLSKKLARIDNEILRKEAEKKLKTENWDYVHKLGIIQNSIYGVDIQPIAVEISKLRFFLSLIVDEKIDDDKSNRGVVPLPNLEFKFVAANSLIGLPKAESGLAESHKDIEKLKELRDTYFTSYGDEKREIERKFGETQHKMFLHSLNLQATGSQTYKLSEWNPFADEAASWFEPEWMFGVKDGFDIVIANPPYLESRHPSFAEELKDKYQNETKKRWGELAKLITRGADLLIYFFELSLHIIHPNGTVVLITQNSWLSSDYGQKFQEFLRKTTNVKAIIDSDFKYFDSSAGPNINTVISIFHRQTVENSNRAFFDRYHENFEKIPYAYHEIDALDNRDYADVHVFKYSDKLIKNMKWGILLNSEEYILDLINRVTMKARNLEDLRGFDLRIGQGLNLSKELMATKTFFEQYPSLLDAAIPFMTADDGAPFVLKKTINYLIDENKIDVKMKNILRLHNLKAYDPNSTTKPKPILIMPRGIGRHFCAINFAGAYSSSYVDIYDYKTNLTEEVILNLWLFLNSSVLWLLREISGRKNLGGGMLKAEATDLKSFPLYLQFNNDKAIKQIYRQLEKREANEIKKEIETQEHKQIDKIVFDYLDISYDMRNKIIKHLQTMIDERHKKSRT